MSVTPNEGDTPSAEYPIQATVTPSQDSSHDSAPDWWDTTGIPYWREDYEEDEEE